MTTSKDPTIAQIKGAMFFQLDEADYVNVVQHAEALRSDVHTICRVVSAYMRQRRQRREVI